MQDQAIIHKHELVEIVIPGGSTLSKYYIPDLPNLRNVHLWGIEVVSAVDVPISIISGNGVIPMTLLKSAFLTLQSYNGKNFVYQFPFPRLHTLQEGTDSVELNPNKFAGQKVNYPKSYVEIADTSLISGVTSQSILLSVTYSDVARIQAQDKKASFRNQS